MCIGKDNGGRCETCEKGAHQKGAHQKGAHQKGAHQIHRPESILRTFVEDILNVV
jgi:hypothetical protein